MKFDVKQLSTLDRAIVGGAGVVFISGFLPWWGYKGSISSLYSASVSGWSAGFTAWAGVLLLTLAGVVLVLRRSGVQLPALPVTPTLLVAAAALLGVVLVLIRWLTLPRVSGGLAGSIGARYGIYVALIAAVVETGAAIAELRASGEPLPWQQPQNV